MRREAPGQLSDSRSTSIPVKQENSIGETSNRPELRENATCDVCGRFGAYQFGNRSLCLDCYTGSGSCCPEFGKDDLWTTQDQPDQARGGA
jgi:hypothetical protein